MGNLSKGAYLLVILIVVEFLAGYVTNQTTTTATYTSGCTTGNNATTCNNASSTSFLASVLNVSVSGFTGAPDVVNALWVLIGALMLVIGIVLISVGIIGSVFGSG